MELTFSVPEMSCEHCVRAVSQELEQVEGVASVAVDLGTKLVVVQGAGLDDARLRAAIADAGYDAA
jgi:copper chaperone